MIAARSRHCQEHCSRLLSLLWPAGILGRWQPARTATVRARVRDELTREIKAVARRQLAEHGSAGLSLRAVAREVGMVSSAVYRYFPSRDDLLTALIIEAYNAVGDGGRAGRGRRPAIRPAGRWLALAGAVRDWARPAPAGVRADLRQPGARLPGAARHRRPGGPDSVAAAAHPATTRPRPAGRCRPPTGRCRARCAPISRRCASCSPATCPSTSWPAAVLAWTQLIGSISFELFGHLHGAIVDYEALLRLPDGPDRPRARAGPAARPAASAPRSSPPRPTPRPPAAMPRAARPGRPGARRAARTAAWTAAGRPPRPGSARRRRPAAR